MEYISTKLDFAITIPSDWKVSIDKLENEPEPSLQQRYEIFLRVFPDSTLSLEEFESQETEVLKVVSAEEGYQKLLDGERAKVIKREEFKKVYEQDRKRAYRMFFGKLLGMPGDEVLDELASRELPAEEAYERLMTDPETFLIDFETFRRQYENEQKVFEEQASRRQEIEQMQEGFFEASPSENADYPSVEVIKLQFKRPMTPLELYLLDKPNSNEVIWGARPSKTTVIDGMSAVTYYYIPGTPIMGEWNADTKHFVKYSLDDQIEHEKANLGEEPHKFANVYLTEGDTGWIISCSCMTSAFPKNKNVFTSIVNSFRSISTKEPTNRG